MGVDFVLDIFDEWMAKDDPALHSSARGPSAQTTTKAMRAFVKSMLKKTGCSIQVLLTATVYMHRIRTSGAHGLTRASFCILTSVCLYIASKFLHDEADSVKRWASAAGFAVADFVVVERQLLRVLQFELFVSCDDLQAFLRQCVQASDTVQNLH